MPFMEPYKYVKGREEVGEMQKIVAFTYRSLSFANEDVK
jgi:hypothetical protein